MMRKKYMKPATQVINLNTMPQFMAASAPPSVSVDGLDLGEELIGSGPEGLPLPAAPWDTAW